MSYIDRNNQAPPALHTKYDPDDARYVCNVLGPYCHKTETWTVMHTTRNKRCSDAIYKARLWIKKQGKN